MVVIEQEESGMGFLPSGDSPSHCGNKIRLGRGGPRWKGMALCRGQHRLSMLLEGAGKGSLWMWAGDASLKDGI